MKSAEEHHHSQKYVDGMRQRLGANWKCSCVSCEHVRAIQADAHQFGVLEGLKMAAEVAGKSTGPVLSTGLQDAAAYQCAAIRTKDAILSLAQQIKEKGTK